MNNAGVKRVELGGGTLWSDAGDRVIKAVKAVRRVSSLDIWVNVGQHSTLTT